ncbi:MAG: GspH/FimT family pseudopilin [Pseudomonadota bacterium]
MPRYVLMPPTGFTFLELLISLAVLGILLGFALPSFQSLLERAALSASVHKLAAHIALARNSAVVRNQRVTLARLSGSDWSQGWTMFTDPNHNAVQDQDERLLAQDEPAKGILVYGNGSMAQYISFNALGEPVQLNGAFLAGTMLFCSEHKFALALVMSKSGRVRLDKATTKPCP